MIFLLSLESHLISSSFSIFCSLIIFLLTCHSTLLLISNYTTSNCLRYVFIFAWICFIIIISFVLLPSFPVVWFCPKETTFPLLFKTLPLVATEYLPDTCTSFFFNSQMFEYLIFRKLICLTIWVWRICFSSSKVTIDYSLPYTCWIWSIRSCRHWWVTMWQPFVIRVDMFCSFEAAWWVTSPGRKGTGAGFWISTIAYLWQWGTIFIFWDSPQCSTLSGSWIRPVLFTHPWLTIHNLYWGCRVLGWWVWQYAVYGHCFAWCIGYTVSCDLFSNTNYTQCCEPGTSGAY